LSSCQYADWHILTSSERLLYRTNVQVSQEIYVFSNTRANANFFELRKAEVRLRRNLFPDTWVNERRLQSTFRTMFLQQV
jgi:hypothetical protein